MKKLVLLGVFLLATSPPAMADGLVTVIHGIPGLPEEVDVFGNNDMLFSFDFGDIEGPLSLPAGDYFLEVKLAGTTVLSTNASVTDGGNFTVIAHQTFTGDPDNPGIALSVFVNDASAIEFPDRRLIVRHTANAPEVRVQMAQITSFTWFGRSFDFRQGTIRVPSISNNAGQGPAQAGPVDLPRPAADVTLRAGGSPVFSTGVLPLPRNVVYIAYAVGDFFGDSFTVLLQAIDLNTTPASLETDAGN